MADLDETRRRFMAHFAGVGLGATLAPGVLWARMQDAGTSTVTLAMVDDALKLSGVELSEEDRKQLVETANKIARAGLVLAALAMCGVVFLAFDLAAGAAAGVVASLTSLVGYAVLWLVVPLRAHPPVRSR